MRLKFFRGRFRLSGLSEVRMNPLDPVSFPVKMVPEFASDDEATTWANDVHLFGYTPSEDVLIGGRPARVRIVDGRAQIQRRAD